MVHLRELRPSRSVRRLGRAGRGAHNQLGGQDPYRPILVPLGDLPDESLDRARPGHFRCFPGEGALDVTGVVAAALEAGYQGPLSLEVFSDAVREAEPGVTARDAMRSLLFLEDRLARVVTGSAAELVVAAPPPAARTDYVELLQRRGGYEGYGSSNTHVRLAAQSAS